MTLVHEALNELRRTPATLTAVEYLVLERAAETKSEYIDGEMRPMTGASRKHNLIAGNIYAYCITNYAEVNVKPTLATCGSK